MTGRRWGVILLHGTMEANSVTVKVKFMGDLRAIVGKRETTTNLPQGSTVKDLLTSLCDNYGEAFTARVLNQMGNLEHYVLVFLNGKNIKELEGLATILGEGEVEFMMLPMFEGG
jgi:MoaD family protein